MKTVRIIALHLAYGGIEKAVISLANLLADKYKVEILSLYNMPDSPAFPLKPEVEVKYLLNDIPNREEWKAAVRDKKPLAFIKESARSVKILRDKKQAVINAVKSIHDGVIITTRNEDNVLLSKYGDKNVLKIAQLHQDHGFDKKLINDFKNNYGNIDIFALLTPGLCDELREVMKENKHTRIVCVPNFLDHFPPEAEADKREKTILGVGRLDAVKGFDRLIRCFEAVHSKEPEWKLKIAGAGDEEERLRGIISDSGLEDSVILLGKLSSDRVEEEMLKASIFAMSSHSEGFPFVLLEAKSCGLPTVAFDVRVGPRAVLNDGEDAFIIEDNNEKEFSEKILQLISSEKLRNEMSLNAVHNVRKFSSERLYEVWTGLIGE